MIVFQGLSKAFKEGVRGIKVTALKDLNLTVNAGEVFGFLGPNGAGKSTAIKALLNLIRPDQGSVTVAGLNVADPATRKQIGYLPENPYFYDYLTADELLFFGGRVSGMSRPEIKRRSDELLQKVLLSEARNRQLRTYSKGMVQRAGLALSIIHDPDVVVLDEPMSGLDPIGRKMVVDLIRELRDQGKTVFFSSHILTDIEHICDRIAIIAGGEIRLCDRVDKILCQGQSLEDVFISAVGDVGGEVR